MQLEFLRDLVIVLGAAIVVVAVTRRIGLPSIAGFIITGVLAGPNAFGLVHNTHEVEVLAEVGVVLLLFGIGLELSLDRLAKMYKAVLIGGGLQMLVTMAVGMGIAKVFGFDWPRAIFIGAVIAISSTAVVLRGLAARGELATPHGQLAVGILVFQDLCVVPMMLFIPFLAGEGSSARDVLLTLGTAAAVLLGVVVGGRVAVPRLLSFVAITRDRDLFILAVFFVCIGTAWAVSQAGISLALGAFLAGLVVGGSEFRHQALLELIPTREVLSSLFFVSVGMLLDPGEMLRNLGPILGVLVLILAGKSLIVLATATVLRLPLRVAILAGAALSQVGEFSFVLIHAAEEANLIDTVLAHDLLVPIILSMLLTPFALASAPHVASSARRIPGINRLLDSSGHSVAPDDMIPTSHVIIAGYGLAGRALCAALRERNVEHTALDMNPVNVRAAKAAGSRAALGDITHPEMLEAVDAHQASLVVLCINDPMATEIALRSVRRMAPNAKIIARTQYQMDVQGLLDAGADRVVAAETAVSDVLVEAALADNGPQSDPAAPIADSSL